MYCPQSVTAAAAAAEQAAGGEEARAYLFQNCDLLAEIAVEQVKSVITVLDEAGCKAVAGVMGTNQRDVSAKDRRIQQASVL